MVMGVPGTSFLPSPIGTDPISLAITQPDTVAGQLAAFGPPSAMANNPALAMMAGGANPAGGLGALLQGVKAPEAAKPIFSAGISGAQNVPAPGISQHVPIGIKTALGALPGGGTQAQLPTLGALIAGAR